MRLNRETQPECVGKEKQPCQERSEAYSRRSYFPSPPPITHAPSLVVAQKRDRKN